MYVLRMYEQNLIGHSEIYFPTIRYMFDDVPFLIVHFINLNWDLCPLTTGVEVESQNLPSWNTQ